LAEALDRLVPAFPDDGADWDDVVARAPGAGRAKWLMLAAAALVAVALLATPAFGLHGFVANLLGRIDAPFTGGEPAPRSVKAQFYDWNLRGPGFDVIASQTRQVATYREDGRTHVLYVAPSRNGGFCWVVTRSGFGGCDPWPRVRRASPPRRLAVNGWQMGAPNGVQWVGMTGGTLRLPAAKRLVARYADGSSDDIRFYYVSKPINAGIFVFTVPDGHDAVATRLQAIEALDADGKVLARKSFPYFQQRVHREPRPRPVTHPAPRPLRPHMGAPTLPVQRGKADGVSLVAGHNGVVEFDLSRASSELQGLARGASASYACFRRVPFHPDLVGRGAIVRFRSATRPVMHIVESAFSPPYDGCAIGGGYGHTWPDRFDGHAAVEVPLTPRGRRYFDERATARDLAAFIRSKPLRTLRQLEGADLEHALRTSRYAGYVTRIDSVTARLPAHRIGYVLGRDSTTYAEESATGRRFSVTVEEGRIRAKNFGGMGGFFF
jgi:hypothetical protein